MKMKEFGPPGGARVPLDPPMHCMDVVGKAHIRVETNGMAMLSGIYCPNLAGLYVCP